MLAAMMETMLNPIHMLMAFLSSALSDGISTMVGGGGFINQSLLVLLGVPAAMAIVTDAAAGFGCMLTGSWVFHRSGLVNYRAVGWLMPGLLLGPWLGAHWLASLSDHTVERLVGFIAICGAGVFLWVKPKSSLTHTAHKHWPVLGLVLGLVLGAYYGMIAAGAGTLMILCLCGLAGMSVKEASASKQIMLLPCTLSTAAAAWQYQLLDLPLLATVVAGSAVGGIVGSFVTLRLSETWLRRLLAGLVVILAIRVLVNG